MAEKLEFIETYTMAQFKDLMKVDKIKVRKNPHTGKLFFTYGSKNGVVSQIHGAPKQSPMISYVKGNPTEQNPDGYFYLLHEEGQGAEVICEY